MQLTLSDEQATKILADLLVQDYKAILSGEFSEDCKRLLPAYESLFSFYLSNQEKAKLEQDLKEKEPTK